tara:strand:- start:69 stop:839 length:771 start_codon:yes stop_codon:yes gene_type:complete
MVQADKQTRRSAVAYLRVSTDEQANSGLGLKAQKDRIKQYAKSQGLHIKKYYTDAGVSGARGAASRPALNDMLTSLTAGTTVLVAKRDRISRDTFLSLWVEKECKRVHATIESAAGEGNGDDPASEMMRRIVDAFSEYERNLISERTKAALAKTNKRLGAVPFGWKRTAAGAMIEVKKEQEVLELILEMRDDHINYTQIAKRLNNEGFTTKRGKDWSAVQVMRICKQRDADRDREAVSKEVSDLEETLEEWEVDQD